MRIDVTAEDIREGVPYICTMCPIALAILRQTGQVVAAGSELAAAVPSVYRFMQRYDDLGIRGEGCLLYIEPFSFELPDFFLNAIAP